MSPDTGRLDRLELKLDRLQDLGHQNHLELLACFQKDKEETVEEIAKINLRLERHDSYFGMVIKALGLGGIIGSWLSVKEFFGGPK